LEIANTKVEGEGQNNKKKEGKNNKKHWDKSEKKGKKYSKEG